MIYWLTLDKKTYYLALGDEIALGVTDTDITEFNYAYYVKEYFQNQGKLEKYVNSYIKSGHRITDIVNDIKNNQIVSVNDKKITLKNALIKSDLVTISVNNNDVLGKINSIHNLKDLYSWIDELSVEYEEMLEELRNYCKEEIIVIGYYYPNNENQNSEFVNILNYLNNSFKEISSFYNVRYINLSDIFIENVNLVGKQYPTEEGYKIIGEQVIVEINSINR